jgi:N-acetylneuraminic acid mutarotase
MQFKQKLSYIATQKADMPTARMGHSASVVDGKIYAIGGGGVGTGTVEAYDPVTDTWTRKAEMPTARRNFSTCVVAGKIYAIGGWYHSNQYPYPTVEQYDPITDTWTKEADLPEPRALFSTSVVDGRIYVIGGTFRPHPCPATSTVYEYEPATENSNVE